MESRVGGRSTVAYQVDTFEKKIAHLLSDMTEVYAKL